MQEPGPKQSKTEHLSQLLQDYHPQDKRETGFKEQMLNVLKHGDEAFTRHFFEPGHFTASAFILSPTAKEVLMIFHSKLHKWLQPGGHIDPEDQHILASARREVLEEVSLRDVVLFKEGIFDIDIHTIPARKGEPDHLHLDIRFLFQAQTQVMEAGSDAEDARWIALDKIDEIKSDDSVLRAISKIQSL